MVDKHGNTLKVGDIVVINQNVRPKYVGDAVCEVIEPRLRKFSIRILKMKAGGPNSYKRRFSEDGVIIGIQSSLLTKIEDGGR
jgi:hypothetical protein